MNVPGSGCLVLKPSDPFRMAFLLSALCLIVGHRQDDLYRRFELHDSRLQQVMEVKVREIFLLIKVLCSLLICLVLLFQ